MKLVSYASHVNAVSSIHFRINTLILFPYGMLLQDEELAYARKAMWCNLSDNARLQFGWPDPGIPRDMLQVSLYYS